jgi:Ca2+-binding EF-hand superfamily protein
MINGINSSNSLMGQLNMTSARPKPEEMFAKIDSNGDGSIDKTEMQSFSEQISNQDGDTIDISKMFTDMDTDGDGSISKDEFLAAKPPEMKGGQGPGQPPDPEEMFGNMDANGDGTISKDEMKAFMEKMPARGGKTPDLDKMFSENDTDGDGKITREEFVKAETKRQAQMQAMMSQTQSTQNISNESALYLLKALQDNDTGNLSLNQTILDQYSNLLSGSFGSSVNLLT